MATIVPGAPATVGFGKPVSVIDVALLATTVTVCEPVIEAVTVSVAVIDLLPAVLSVAVNTCTPLSLPAPVVYV